MIARNLSWQPVRPLLVLVLWLGGASILQTRPAPVEYLRAAADYCTRDEDLSTSPPDSVLLRVAVVLNRAAPEASRLWPGFWPPDEEVLLHRGGEAVLLLSPAEPPTQLAPLAGQEVPPGLTVPAYLFRGTLEDFHRLVGPPRKRGEDVIATPWAMPVVRTSLRQSLETIYHEHFHLFQSRRFAEMRTPGIASDQPDRLRMQDSVFAARFATEREILMAALDAAAPGSMRALLRAYLAVRHERIGENDTLRAAEGHMERVEGTAQLLGILASHVAVGCEREAIRPVLKEALNRPQFGRVRFYNTGAALGYLLDELQVPWQQEVQAGEFMHEVLGRAVAFSASEARPLAEEALQRFGPAGPR